MGRAIDSDALKEYIKKTDLTAVERGALLQAISNMPTLTPPNEPLTLEELREMDGKPVWIERIESDSTDDGEWALVFCKEKFCRTSCGNIVLFCWYGTGWLAYRRPPEGK